MKINDANVIKEMKNIQSNIKMAYSHSNSDNCDRFLAKSIGQLETLISVLSIAEDEE